MNPKVDVVIVNWNTGKQLQESLSALSRSRRDGYDFGSVVVIDNASADGSANNLDFPALPLTVVQNQENRGFAAASNQGAALGNGDYLLFLNPDTQVAADALAKSVSQMGSPESARVGILGIQLVDEQGRVTRDCSRFLATKNFMHMMFGLNRVFPSIFPGHLYADWDHKQSRQIEHVMGSYFFVRRRVFKEIGPFDERFFLYYEDVDFSLRALQSGWTTYFLATAQCYHLGGGSTRQIKARRLFYTLRSRIFYAFKHFGVVNATWLLLATLGIEPFTRLVQGVLRGSPEQLREVTQAYFFLWSDLSRILGSKSLRNPELVRASRATP